jgi:hypothetical protein
VDQVLLDVKVWAVRREDFTGTQRLLALGENRSL